MDTSLEKIAEESWGIYGQFLGAKYVLHPSIPIMYFGDYKKYLNSDIKIVTVGLNPSKIEFKGKSVFSRFPDAETLYERFLHGQDFTKYLSLLNNYFHEDPYRNWFDNYEHALSGFNCSFYGKKSNAALHTDILSPLATDPRWSKLDAGAKRELSNVGIVLWHKLTEFLLPDIILVSIRRSYLDEIRFKRLGVWKTVFSVERKNPYDVSVQRVEILPGKIARLVFGKAAEKPFATIKHPDKRLIGSAVLKSMADE